MRRLGDLPDICGARGRHGGRVGGQTEFLMRQDDPAGPAVADPAARAVGPLSMSVSSASSATTSTAVLADPFEAARRRLVDYLIRYALVESYFTFQRHRRPYPFAHKHALLPNTDGPKAESRYQNTAFMILRDGRIPQSLIKHFRLRRSNLVNAANIARMVPGLDLDLDLDLGAMDAARCEVMGDGFEGLFRGLAPLDYALVMERHQDEDGSGQAGPPEGPVHLTHMHVKVERLTDNAVNELARDLGYVERRLFERGEDYVDRLEAKFYEYFGFSANASGRKSAAAMAAQMLGVEGGRFNVLLSNQDDCRMTVLDESELITQYMLLRLDRNDTERFTAQALAAGADDGTAFRVISDGRGQTVVIYRLTLRRTAAARPGPRQPGESELDLPWLEIADEALVAVPARQPVPGPQVLTFPWAIR